MSMHDTLGSSSLFQMTDCVPERQSFGGYSGGWGQTGVHLQFGDIDSDDDSNLAVNIACNRFYNEHPGQHWPSFIYLSNFAVFAVEHLIATSEELNSNNPPALSTFTVHIEVINSDGVTTQTYRSEPTSCVRSFGFDRLEIPINMWSGLAHISLTTHGATRVAENFTSGIHCQSCMNDSHCEHFKHDGRSFVNGTCKKGDQDLEAPNLCVPRQNEPTSQSDDSNPSIWTNSTFILVLVSGSIAALIAIALFLRMFCCPPKNTLATSIPMQYQRLQGAPQRAKQGVGNFSGSMDQTVLID